MRSKADISNHAIRVFLQQVGGFYDKERGFKKFIPSQEQKEEILKFFDFRCCYCQQELTIQSTNQDHLIAMNKASLGLHAWGNVVPCCYECNKKKNKKDWVIFLGSICSEETLENRKKKISLFIEKYNYMPNLYLKEIVNNLYQDVGEVADTLIRLRYKQAEEVIRKLV